MSQKILITGGTGLVGSALIPMLKAEGHEVVVLSRRKFESSEFKVFVWDYEKEYIEDGALDEVTAIIHLAGAGVAEKKWSPERKELIYNSRTKTSMLLFRLLEKGGHQVETFIAASAIGIYGNDTGNYVMKESSKRGNDFLAHVTDAWETATHKIASLGIRLVQLRVGVVLSHKGGALVELLKPPVAAPLGKGTQYMSWIHVDDLCRMFLAALNNTAMTGPYNAVGPKPETNRELTKEAAKVFKKTYLPIPVPGLVLKLMLGEMAGIVLGGSRVSSEAIQKTGFEFKFPKLPAALNDLVSRVK